MQTLPGFRDFLPDDCATRNYIFSKWREVARRYGFVEWDGPPLELTELYKKKSGDEIVRQLFRFQDQKQRDVSMRPELTPSLARVVTSLPHEYKKPLKWFSIGQFFRYEKKQRGRLREHYQLNCDIVGEQSAAADAELVALCVDLLRAFGFSESDFLVRVSNRKAWSDFLASRQIEAHRVADFLDIIDKFERTEVSVVEDRLAAFGLTAQDVTTFAQFPFAESTQLAQFLAEIRARNLEEFVLIDPMIVRGLAYYTGFVFEVFDRLKRFRAIAGGGRYDQLIGRISDNRIEMPALGFAMGDVVLTEFIKETPRANRRLKSWIKSAQVIDAFVIVAEESKRFDALGFVERLRQSKWRIDLSIGPARVKNQFERAEYVSARYAIIIGAEWPLITIKDLKSREQTQLESTQSIRDLKRKLQLWQRNLKSQRARGS